MPAEVAAALREEAQRSHERRLLVLAGGHEACLAGSEAALDAAGIDRSGVVYVGDAEAFEAERVPMARAGDLLGTTQDAVVFDAHAGLRATLLGRVVGAVDGGGLLVLCCPPLDGWADRRDPADVRLAVPPYSVEAVTGRFRARLVETLRAHRGVAVVDVDAGVVEADGLTHPDERPSGRSPAVPAHHAFPGAAYEACLTADQVDALEALEALRGPGNAVVIEADRGRGKSSVAGLAAAGLALEGDDVAITAPRFRSARAGFERARALLDGLAAIAAIGDRASPRAIEVAGGGRIRFVGPADLSTATPDVLVVDEAAGLGVPVLTACLAVDRVAFATTVHGYEGAGRGFSVRFRDRLEASELSVVDVSMREPIRYAPGDPVEVWAFNALLLDARPAVAEAVADARPATADYRRLTPDELLDDEARLRELFGLLVLAHYRTEPDDLARLLDAPNVAVRALLYEGHVASVALLAKEGGLPADRRRDMYEGGRVRGNMLPDVLTSQLRDEGAGALEGWRILRIATHDAVRSRGLGSRLLEGVEDELDDVDWLGTGYGATPDLLSFWAEAGYSTVHLATTRNAASGEHSVLMLRPTSAAGRALADRHGEWFASRVVGQLTDALSDLDPDVVRASLRATDVAVEPGLDDRDWRLVVGMAYGPGLLDVDPRPFRSLAAAHLIDPDDPDRLDDDAERLLVRRVLQARPWGAVADDLGFESRATCMRATGAAFRPLVEAYGPESAMAERDRYR